MSKQVQEFAVEQRTAEEMGIQELLLKLERNQATVQRISSRLGSYKMEPTSQECFDRLADLRTGFRDLARDQMLLLGRLKQRREQEKSQWPMVEDLLSRFKELQEDLASYLLLARGY